MIRLIRRTFCTIPKKFDISSRIGGSSVENLYGIYQGKYKNQAVQNIKYSIPGCTIITKPQQCIRCVQTLMKTNTIAAWDTETIDLDIKNQAPIGKGKILCASFFAGPQYDFGNGPKVLIDNFGTNAGLINYFKDYLQNPSYLKVWHNYGFDRHIFYNHGINVQGFGGDTMHMARLWDSSRMPGQYSLSALTKSLKRQIYHIAKTYKAYKLKEYKFIIQESTNQQQIGEYTNKINLLEKYQFDENSLVKKKLQQLFYRKKILKSGGQGKTYEYPTTITLHTSQQYVKQWLHYSLLDSQATFYLRQTLQQLLKKQRSAQFPGFNDMWELYQKQWLPFGEILTDMERQGFKVNVQHFINIHNEAQKTLKQKKAKFMQFVQSVQNDPHIYEFNPSSNAQMQQFLHAPCQVNKTINQEEENQAYDQQQLQLLQNAQPGSKKTIIRKKKTQLLQTDQFKVPNTNPDIKRATIQMYITGLGIPPVSWTPSGLPSVDQSSLKVLRGKPKQGKYGKAYEHFQKIGNPQFGKKLCQALDTLSQYRSIETLLKTFIIPLIEYIDQSERIHCSLNINTETGRLSARKPNLQNQPALQKDIYKIRQAFIAQKGKKLIVADYGQLQLRVLAHITNCKEMIKAFKQGGDFHSRTAIGMYNYIRKEIQEGKVLLQWDKSKGVAPAPLIKDKYASQRRKAKTVNFSIAYGKTARGFAEDWNCSVEQAQQVIKAWFSDRPEVERWQKFKKKQAKELGLTKTLLGRHRPLDKFYKMNQKGMAERRAINTPIQGGAADIVMASMVKIAKNQRLKQLGWKLQLQIHDELILQGPQQSAKQALQIVKYDMSHPFDTQLRLELQIDAKIGDNWYECK